MWERLRPDLSLCVFPLIRPDSSYFLFLLGHEEGFELSSPLSDLSEQSVLIGATAGSLLLSWIKRKRGNREALFSSLNICETVVHHGERKEERPLRLNAGAE